MIYSQCLMKIRNHLKSIRILEDHVSFDMEFPNSWSIPKSASKPFEVLTVEQNDTTRIVSFVGKIDTKVIDEIEHSLDYVVKYNKDKEEKERLFKIKVQELKGIFENQNLEELKHLKFDVDIETVIETTLDSEDGET